MKPALAVTAAAALSLALAANAQQRTEAAAPPPSAAGETDPAVARLRKLEDGIAKQLETMSSQMEALRQELARLRGQIQEYSSESRVARGGKPVEPPLAGAAPAAAAVAAQPVEAPAQPPAATAAAPEPVDTTPRIAVKGFRFTGNSLLSEDQLEASVQSYAGKDLTLDQINEAIGRVRQAYLDRGLFLARTYLPEQDIKDGIVEVGVVEGKLGKVNVVVEPDARLSESLAKGIVENHLRPGEPITEAGLERPLLLLRDLPRITAESTIESGANVGEADLTVRVKQNPDVSLVTGDVGLDNHGNRYTGQYRLGLGLNVNNPFGIGDLATFRGYIPNADGTLFGQLAYIAPVGSYGTKLGLSVGKLNYVIGKEFAALDADGVADIYTAYAVHPVIRTRAANLFAQFALDYKLLTDRQANINTSEDRTVRDARFVVSGDARDAWLGLNVGSVGYTLGDLSLDSEGLEVIDQSPIGFKTAGSYQKLNYDYRRLQQVVPDVTALFAITGQWASKNLTSAEKMSLGGPDAVRAYPVGEDTGDEGYYGTVELRYTGFGLKVVPVDVMVSAFYDFGLIRFNAEPADAPAAALLLANRKRLAGYGLGLNVGKDGDYMFRSSLAWRLSGPPTSDLSENARQQPRIWVQAIKWF